jgi:hypothetical protein
LRSHYLSESQFTLIGLRGAHEKGGIEGEVGRFRRRHLVPVPAVGSLAELNARLLGGCERDLARQITGRRGTVGEALARERPLLRALPEERAQTAEHTRPRVDAKAMVTVRQNRYSVPVGLVGLRVLAEIGARRLHERASAPEPHLAEGDHREIVDGPVRAVGSLHGIAFRCIEEKKGSSHVHLLAFDAKVSGHFRLGGCLDRTADERGGR